MTICDICGRPFKEADNNLMQLDVIMEESFLLGFTVHRGSCLTTLQTGMRKLCIGRTRLENALKDMRNEAELVEKDEDFTL